MHAIPVAAIGTTTQPRGGAVSQSTAHSVIGDTDQSLASISVQPQSTKPLGKYNTLSSPMRMLVKSAAHVWSVNGEHIDYVERAGHLHYCYNVLGLQCSTKTLDRKLIL